MPKLLLAINLLCCLSYSYRYSISMEWWGIRKLYMTLHLERCYDIICALLNNDPIMINGSKGIIVSPSVLLIGG